MLLDLLAPLQQDIEELHEAKGGQQETQHLNMGQESNGRRIEETFWIYSHIYMDISVLGILWRKTGRNVAFVSDFCRVKNLEQ